MCSGSYKEVRCCRCCQTHLMTSFQERPSNMKRKIKIAKRSPNQKEKSELLLDISMCCVVWYDYLCVVWYDYLCVVWYDYQCVVRYNYLFVVRYDFLCVVWYDYLCVVWYNYLFVVRYDYLCVVWYDYLCVVWYNYLFVVRYDYLCVVWWMLRFFLFKEISSFYLLELKLKKMRRWLTK